MLIDVFLTLPVVCRCCGQGVTAVSNQEGYASYLLRLKGSDRDGQRTWRASLESTLDGQRLEFNSLEALIAFLEQQYGRGEAGTAGAREGSTARG
jgi:hypothetical protein